MDHRDQDAALASAPAGSASSTAGRAETLSKGLPAPADEVRKAVNPQGLPVYAGPTGTIRGTVTVSGDAAPVRKDLEIPSKCALAKDMYGRVFREGMMRSLADVLVTVTGYNAYVPAKSVARSVEARGCAWDTLTLALTFGQRIDVTSKDRESYMPDLVGGRMPAIMVAVPGGDAVQVYPWRPGRYALADKVHPYATADVFVLKFATFDVTGLDGKYEISGIPVGDVALNAVLPATMQVVEKKLRIEPNRELDVDLQFKFDKRAFAAGADAGASVPPASSDKRKP